LFGRGRASDVGIGKTRLLADLRRRADFGALQIVVQAFDQVRDPYAPLVIAVARALDESSGRVAEQESPALNAVACELISSHSYGAVFAV
jgi:hypothetical protein